METGCHLISHSYTFSAQGILAPLTSGFHWLIHFIDYSWSLYQVYKGVPFQQQTVPYWFFSLLGRSSPRLTQIVSSTSNSLSSGYSTVLIFMTMIIMLLTFISGLTLYISGLTPTLMRTLQHTWPLSPYECTSGLLQKDHWKWKEKNQFVAVYQSKLEWIAWEIKSCKICDSKCKWKKKVEIQAQLI